MHVKVQGPAEALNQGDGAGSGGRVGKSSFMDQMRGQRRLLQE